MLGVTKEQRAHYDAAVAKHGAERVSAGEVKGHFFVIRSPTREEYQRSRSYVMDPAKRHLAHAVIVADCVLHPEGEALESIFNRWPGLEVSVGEFIMDAAGAGAEVEKKL